MKSRLLLTISSLSLLTLVAMPVRVVAQEGQQQQTEQPQRYTVTDLGPVGNPFSQATYVNNPGLVTGLDTAPDGAQHAVLWYEGLFTDISTPGLGGPNSGAGGVNEFGQVIGGAETSDKDPNNENFCGYGTGLQCLAFLWQNGVMTPLPTLGGTNAGYGRINNQGEVAGYAEEDIVDKECPGKVAVTGAGPQLLYFEAVVWGPRPGEIRKLRPLKGDSVGIALSINDNSQAVGTSGSCANTTLPGPTAGPHAVLWERDGSVLDLGNLGGTSNPAVLAVGNAALSINNRGLVSGVSALPEIKDKGCPGNPPNPVCFPFHPFLWTRETGMRDLGVLPGDFVGAGLGINNKGEVVGPSFSSPGPTSGSPRAFLWRNGVMHDLNALIPSDSPLYLLIAYGINDSGEIAGFGVQTSTGDIHAFLATPCGRKNVDTDWCKDHADGAAAEADKTVEKPNVFLSESARQLLQQQLGFGRFGVGHMGPQ
jgi:probable HAF family extracellular repeat protein